MRERKSASKLKVNSQSIKIIHRNNPVIKKNKKNKKMFQLDTVLMTEEVNENTKAKKKLY